jgi:hypothetical protein
MPGPGVETVSVADETKSQITWWINELGQRNPIAGFWLRPRPTSPAPQLEVRGGCKGTFRTIPSSTGSQKIRTSPTPGTMAKFDGTHGISGTVIFL